ncbi:hypothetical protein [Legionella longbeachae]|uniref:Putative membrane protein n=1 Tax=Legionella longbeachae serogroup 1 (strain NSW150) TaxID=661367 RepID=D3HNG8_LEGLN|nr:hypothetical protein [Legionella longbeachae]VEE00957.1 Uncharacterised protein [Legionella oakridgensis]HBD7399070.1 hypothetical protein [Legionella pneumophila]ARB92656.1 hypothetical protein A6J40_10915 [Legionella longbeachae]ARM34169.1 hypothetical protein B0B39_11810 [Legionella longbeachae]EEZ96579.1 hypothetical protein LLB_1774 [Legionella longbeachae D-4968]
MKKTFDLLAKLNIDELNKLKDPQNSKELQDFIRQLNKDFKKYVAPGYFDPMKQADNWLAQVRNLALQGHKGINQASMVKIDKINELYGGMNEVAFITLDMYQTIDTVKHEVERDATLGVVRKAIRDADIKSIIKDYKEHLKGKLEQEGLKKTPEGDIVTLNNEKVFTPKQQKLINRYNAISGVNADFESKKELSEVEISTAKKALQTCLENKPEWSERPFLQKLTDVLSIGFKPLYRAFFSKESKMEEQLDKQLDESTKHGL